MADAPKYSPAAQKLSLRLLRGHIDIVKTCGDVEADALDRCRAFNAELRASCMAEHGEEAGGVIWTETLNLAEELRQVLERYWSVQGLFTEA